MTTTPNPPRDELPPLPGALASGLRGLRVDVAPGRDLWPGIAAGLGPRTGEARCGDPSPPDTAGASAPSQRDRRRRFRRRNAGYATAAAVVLAAGIGWQLWPASTLPPGPPPAPEGAVAAADAAAGGTDTPLLHAADALAREYQGALREVHSAREALVGEDRLAGLDAQLERSATEVRAALARDPHALHLFQRLQRIYAHRLALSLRQA